MTAGLPPEAEGSTAGVMEAAAGTPESDGSVLIIQDSIPIEINNSTLQDGDVLIWDEGSQTWVNQQFQGGGAEDGFHLPLGEIEIYGDGSWSPGGVPLTNDTPVSEAIDRMNEALAKLIPVRPPEFPNGSLTVSNSTGSTPFLASGVTDHTAGGSGYSPGSAVTRITAAGVSSFTLNDVGPGDSGALSLWVNDVSVATKTLTGTGDEGNYGGLVISDQKDYPTGTPGFWKSIDVALNLVSISVGINKIEITHSDASPTNDLFFVRDAMTSNPALSAGSVVQAALGTPAYSSSVPHYGTGGVLTVGVSLSNLAGETYYGGSDPFSVSGTNSTIVSQAFGYAALGIAVPLARQTVAPVSVTPVTVQVNGATHGAGVVQGTGRNVNGSVTSTLAATRILVKRGTAAANRIDEMSVPVTGLGSVPNSLNAVRVSLGAGDTPAGAAVAWDSAAALASHEAAVVGGALSHDQNDYSTGTLPQGPDLSVGRSGPQYATFAFQRASRSTFKINITGSYAGCWIKLPGVSDDTGIAPNAPNGWWDATKAYDGAGVPGETGDVANGCALGTVMNGASGSFTITFGTQSSTNSQDNTILIRLRLNAGQSNTALSFSN